MSDEDNRKVTVHIPADADVSEFEVGTEITITIKGKVIGGEFRLKKEEWQDAKGRLEVEVDTITAGGKNLFESLVD
jgi:hypothetical protein